MAKRPSSPPVPKQEDRLGLQKVQEFLSRFQIGGLQLSEFPAPPEHKAARAALTATGALTALVGAWALAMAVWQLNAVFLSLALSLLGLGVATALYSQPDSNLARAPLPRHPSTKDDEVRSVWETLLTFSAVVGLTNLALGTVLTSMVWMFVHRGLALALSVGLNLVAGWIGYLGDGENRRPILPASAATRVETEDIALPGM